MSPWPTPSVAFPAEFPSRAEVKPNRGLPRMGVAIAANRWHGLRRPLSVCSPKAPSMSETPNWHDAHALMLIDQALEQGTFTAELVAQINRALAAARQADPTHRSATPRANHGR